MSTTKWRRQDETNNFTVDQELITSSIIDQPLIIVLDQDDDLETFDPTSTTCSNNTPRTYPDEQTIIPNVKSPDATVHSPSKSKPFRQSSKLSPTILINTNFVPQTIPTRRRKKSISKRKTNTSTNHLPPNSLLSFITFNQVSNILTVSRMGSIYYCVEDLYVKIFTLLCTFDQFINFLLEAQIILFKSVTLSEKIAITQANSLLSNFNQIRYRLISIDFSDYLLRLKQLLITNQNAQQLERIVDELRSYKQTSTLFHQKNSDKQSLSPPSSFSDLSSDNIERNKRLKSITNRPSPSKIPIPHERFPVNQTVLSKTHLTECATHSATPLSRSESLIFNRKRPENRVLPSSSLPSIKVDFRVQTQRTEPGEDNHSMPMIVNVEGNVQSALSNIHPNHVSSNVVHMSRSTNIPYLSAYHVTPVQTHYGLYYPGSHSYLSIAQKPRNSLVDHRSQMLLSSNSLSHSSSPIITSLLERPVVHHSLTFDKQIPPISAYIPQQSINNQSFSYRDFHSDERIVDRQYRSKAPSSICLKQHRSSLSSYPAIRTYLTPVVNHRSSLNKLSPPVSQQNSLGTGVGWRSPSLPFEGIDLSRAILEHNHCDIDKLPKLVVRHSKTYPHKTIDTMGQLFPSWFNEPDYRCIHCFNCDRVFTPQFFMIHVDDKQLITIQPLSMTSIQLLTSETMSEWKVRLWNQFCANLNVYSRNGRIGGF